MKVDISRRPVEAFSLEMRGNLGKKQKTNKLRKQKNRKKNRESIE
jgi:hypothetical protein